MMCIVCKPGGVTGVGAVGGVGGGGGGRGGKVKRQVWTDTAIEAFSEGLYQVMYCVYHSAVYCKRS